jgi:hypothetical protein
MGTGGSSCNPSNSGGRNQEDCSSKPAQANSSRDPILKKTITKKKKSWWSSSMCRTLGSSLSTTRKGSGGREYVLWKKEKVDRDARAGVSRRGLLKR